MQLFGLTLNGEVVGVRAVLWEVGRAYDMGIALFERYNEGKISVSELSTLPLVENAGRFYTRDEFSKNAVNADGKCITNYLELIYDTEVCNLVDFLVKYPNVEIGVTKIEFDECYLLIDEVDFGRGAVFVRDDRGIAPCWDQIALGMLSSYKIVE